mmetsp:Transcript_39829/g.71618  ORF Transcript_39829/g.71618 Transcript_39829/m.71618 type:complete len:229 (+) Transcript_39829:63-749(+)
MSTAGSDSDSGSGSQDPSAVSKLSSASHQPVKPAGPWKCRTFPSLHPNLEGHLYGQTSRMGHARWLNAQIVVGTKSWYEANKGSFRRHAQDPGRSTWVPHAKGAVHGNPSKIEPPVMGYQPPGGARWSPLRHPNGKRKKKIDDGSALQASLFMSTTRTGGENSKYLGDSYAQLNRSFSDTKKIGSHSRSLLDLSRADSLPSITANSDFPYPPSPAYVRDYMRRASQEN